MSPCLRGARSLVRSAGSPLAILAITVVLVGAAIAAAADLGRADPRAAADSAAFQRLVGGLGTGPALDLVACPAALDVRIGRECPDEVEPVPGLGAACPWRGAGREPGGAGR